VIVDVPHVVQLLSDLLVRVLASNAP
jgi:hypothetical protein